MKVLVNCGSGTNLTPYRELLNVVEVFRSFGWEVDFVLEYDASPRSISLLEGVASKIIIEPSPKLYFKKGPEKLKLLFGHLFRAYSGSHFVQKCLDINEYSILILYTDRELGLTPFLIDCFHRKGKKIYCFQLTYTSVNFLIYSRLKRGEFKKGMLNTLFAFFFPGHVLIRDRESRLFYNPVKALSYMLFTRLSPAPWMVGADNRVSYFSISEEYEVDKMKESEWANKVEIIGSPAIGSLVKTVNNVEEIEGSFSLKYPRFRKGYENIIIMLPQLWEHHLMCRDESFMLIDKFIKILIVKHKNENLILSLHPKMSYEDYVYLESFSDRIIIPDFQLKNYISIGSLCYGFFLSTLLWARILKIPSVYCDLISIQEEFFEDLSNKRVVSFEELRNVEAPVHKTVLDKEKVDEMMIKYDFKRNLQKLLILEGFVESE